MLAAIHTGAKAWLCVAFATAAGCGRWGFDVTRENGDDALDAVANGDSGAVDSAPGHTGLTTFASTSSSYATDVVWTSNGPVVTGWFTGSVDLGAGNIPTIGDAFNDAFLVGVDKVGAYRFGATGGVTRLGQGWDIELQLGSTTDVLMGGLFNGMFTNTQAPALTSSPQGPFLQKFSGTGVAGGHSPSVSGTANTQGRALSTGDPTQVWSGGVYAGPTSLGTMQLPNAPIDSAYLATYDANTLAVTAVQAYLGTDVSQVNAVAANASDICVVGAFRGTNNFDSVARAANGWDMFVLHLKPDLTSRWVSIISGAGPQQGTSVALASNGDCIVAGASTDAIVLPGGLMLGADGHQDGFVVRLKRDDGLVAWAQAYDSTTAAEIAAVAVDAQDRVIVLGTFSGGLDDGVRQYTAVAADGFIAGISNTGTPQWLVQLSGDGDVSSGIAGMAVDGVHVAATVNFAGALTVNLPSMTVSATGKTGGTAGLLTFDAPW